MPGEHEWDCFFSTNDSPAPGAITRSILKTEAHSSFTCFPANAVVLHKIHFRPHARKHKPHHYSARETCPLVKRTLSLAEVTYITYSPHHSPRECNSQYIDMSLALNPGSASKKGLFVVSSREGNAGTQSCGDAKKVRLFASCLKPWLRTFFLLRILSTGFAARRSTRNPFTLPFHDRQPGGNDAK